jgi:hypothetical protein
VLKENPEQWKDEYMQNNKTLPGFLALLKNLLEKDYSDAIRCGFQTCGQYPLCPGEGSGQTVSG